MVEGVVGKGLLGLQPNLLNLEVVLEVVLRELEVVQARCKDIACKYVMELCRCPGSQFVCQSDCHQQGLETNREQVHQMIPARRRPFRQVSPVDACSQGKGLMEIDCSEVVHGDGLPNGVHKGEDASTADRSQIRLDCGSSNGTHDKQAGLLNKDMENWNTVGELADLHKEKETLIRADLEKETVGESKDEVLLSVSDMTPGEEVSKAQILDVDGHKKTLKIAQNGIAVAEQTVEALFTSEDSDSKDLEACQGLPDDGHQGSDVLGDTFREQKASVVTVSASKGKISGQVSGSGSVSYQENAENMDQDITMALWVKWRGKWQAGIRCSRDDCPLSTLKAKPTHGRKKYIVVFFPHSRIHCWADTSLICSISERPEPLAYRTHYIGMELVKDLNAPQRFIMQKLAATMFDTSDKLHIEAVIESARSVTAWKEFARNASKCKTYSDLGRMLLKLQSMILSNYISSSWLEHSFNSWACQCKNARSAESVEILMKELMDSVLWNEVSDLWDAPVQPNLGSEWKIMKQEAMKLLSISHPMASTVEGDQKNCVDMVVSGLPIIRKRQKLEVHRSETYQSSIVSYSHEPHLQAINQESSGMVLNVQKPKKETFLKENKNMLVGPGGNELEKSSGLVVKDAQEVYPLTVDVSIPLGGGTSSNLEIVVHAASSSGKKDRQCIAFVESKGRQCGRWANVGDIYCAKHLNFVSPQNISKPKQPLPLFPSSLPLCGGTTTSGKRCKHRSRDGSGYCLKHKSGSYQMLQIAGPSGSPAYKLRRKRRRKRKSSRYVGLETVTGKEIVLVDDVPLQESSRLSMGSGDLYQQMYMVENHVLASSSTATKAYSQDVRRCYGWCRKNDDQCLRKPKHNSSFCEKHTPSWLNCDNQFISYEIFNDLVNSASSGKQKAHLYRASELLYELMKNGLSEGIIQDISRERFMGKILSDVSGDKSVAENLLRLVSGEREKLKRIWGFDENKETNCSSHISSIVAEPLVPAAREHNHNSVVEQMKRCKFCTESFSDDQSLGLHWVKSHKKEAQWLFRGYACGICKVSFTNRKVLIGHVEERHAGQHVDQSILFLCMTCNNHFSSFEQLWLHVVAAHSADLTTQDIQHHKQSLKSSMHGSFHGQPKMGGSQNLSSKKRKKTSEKHSDCRHHADRKFFCRFCGLKFDLLPDLGRHHQAAHMGPSSITPFSPKKSDRSISSGHNLEKHLQHRLKNSYPEINRKTSSFGVKEPLERVDFEKSKMLGLQTEFNERDNVKSMEGCCSDIAKILFSAIQRTRPRPSSLDILAISRTTCCRANLHATLEMKYGSLPEKLYLKAAKLCSELNIQIQWHQDGYICPKGCKPLPDQSISLSPLPDDFTKKLSLPSDSQFLSADANDRAWEMDESHCILKAVCKPRSFKSIVLCEDLSFGKEAVPVPCVVDEHLIDSFYTYIDGFHRGGGPELCMPWKDFTYITTRMLDPSLGLDTKSSQLGCTCRGGTCSPDVCDHVYLFNNDYENAVDIHGKSMRGRFPYDGTGQIILEEGFLVYECNSLCSCDKTCQNRVLQKGVQLKLEVYKTENKGWAVRAGEAIPRGAYVCEYLGEVLDDQNANKRGERYDSEGCSYLYDIDAHIEENGLNEGAVPYVIDATKYGNVARFINHSCSPNLVNYQVLVESMDCQLAHIGLYASRDIAAGEELAYDYRYKLLPGKGCPCHCGAANCRGRLY